MSQEQQVGDHRLQSSHPGAPLTCGQSPGRLQQRPANSPGRVAWLERHPVHQKFAGSVPEGCIRSVFLSFPLENQTYQVRILKKSHKIKLIGHPQFAPGLGWEGETGSPELKGISQTPVIKLLAMRCPQTGT